MAFFFVLIYSLLAFFVTDTAFRKFSLKKSIFESSGPRYS